MSRQENDQRRELEIIQAPERTTESLALPGLYQAEDRAVSFTGQPMTALSALRTRGVSDVDQISQAETVTITTAKEVEIATNCARKLGVGESKLLAVAVSAFTKINTQNAKNVKLRVELDTKDFARANGKEIDPIRKTKAQDQEKENKRAEKTLENFVTKVAKNAENLKSNMSFRWTESLRGKPQAYSGISFISFYRVTKSTMTLEFSQSAAEIIVKWPLMERPRAYYRIDDRKPNAFAIADALISHYGMDNNVIVNTERMFNIGKLITGYTSFPSIDDVRANRWGWDRMIKEPFEQALDHLKEIGLLKCWEYRESKKKAISDAEARNIVSYEQFSGLYLYFELEGYDEHSARKTLVLEKKAQSKEKANKKRRKKTKNHTAQEEEKPQTLVE